MTTRTQPLTHQFLHHMEARGARPTTIRTYRWILSTLPSTLTANSLESWALSMQGLAPATRAQRIAAVRSMTKWACRTGRLRTDPAGALDAPKRRRGVPRPTPERDVMTALECPDPRARLAVSLALLAGLRRCEVAALRWEELDIESRSIRIVEGKGGDCRTVYFGVDLALVLRPFVRSWGPVVPRLKGDTNRNLAPDTIARLVASAMDQRLHPMRHRHATDLYAASRDLLATGQQLGHASPATTRVYVEVVGIDQRKAVESVPTRLTTTQRYIATDEDGLDGAVMAA